VAVASASDRAAASSGAQQATGVAAEAAAVAVGVIGAPASRRQRTGARLVEQRVGAAAHVADLAAALAELHQPHAPPGHAAE
jgi:hypothetical protein